jgi:hypothetical protein
MAGALMMMCSGVKAADRAKYPEWKGAWERYVPPVSVVSPSGLRTPGGQPSFDQTKPWGRGQQAPLTPEYQKVLEDSIADQARGGQAVVNIYEAENPGLTQWKYRGVLFNHPDSNAPTAECPNFFQLGDRLLLSRKLTGNFPDFERVLPKDHGSSVKLQREELRGALERVAQFADDRSRAVRVAVKPGEVKVHSSVSEMGEAEESIPAEYTGTEVEIGFNAEYLLDFLRAVNDSEVAFHFKDAHSAGEMRPGGEKADNYRYVIMPMRI